MEQEILKIENLYFDYSDTSVLRDVNFTLHKGDFLGIIGANGAGKSTLIKAILGDIPHSGTIEFKDRENGHMQKMKIGYVPQSLNIEKKTPISVYDMIASYQSRYPVFWKKSKKVYAKIKEHLAIFKAEDLIDKQVCNLSGGELQRVLLSMAVMDEPNLLLLDEPVSGIDQNGMDLFYHTISELKKHYDLSIILISHDLDYVAQYADQVILIDGTVKKQGTVRQVYESEEFRQVFGRFDLENYKPSRQVKEQQKKEIIMPKHSHGLWKEEE